MTPVDRDVGWSGAEGHRAARVRVGGEREGGGGEKGAPQAPAARCVRRKVVPCRAVLAGTVRTAARHRKACVAVLSDANTPPAAKLVRCKPPALLSVKAMKTLSPHLGKATDTPEPTLRHRPQTRQRRPKTNAHTAAAAQVAATCCTFSNHEPRIRLPLQAAADR